MFTLCVSNAYAQSAAPGGGGLGSGNRTGDTSSVSGSTAGGGGLGSGSRTLEGDTCRGLGYAGGGGRCEVSGTASVLSALAQVLVALY